MFFDVVILYFQLDFMMSFFFSLFQVPFLGVRVYMFYRGSPLSLPLRLTASLGPASMISLNNLLHVYVLKLQNIFQFWASKAVQS